MRRMTARTAIYPKVAEMLQSGESLVISVSGNCMAPLLLDRQRLTVQKQERYLSGDILVFAARDGDLLVHRYLGPAPGERLMTKPDAGAMIDVLVLRSQVMGRVLTANGVAVEVNAVSRARTTLLYIGWLGKLAVERILSRR